LISGKHLPGITNAARSGPDPQTPLRFIWTTVPFDVGTDYGKTTNGAHIKQNQVPTSNGIACPHRPEYAPAPRPAGSRLHKALAWLIRLHSICAHKDYDEPENIRLGTRSSILISLNTRTMYVTDGVPCESEYEKFSLEDSGVEHHVSKTQVVSL
jgi:hypothetical protein